jgi:hypothetical protein
MARVRRGQPVRAADHNAIVDALGRAGVAVSDFGGGSRVPILGMTEDDRIWARLAGSASPYSFTQVVGAAGGGWATPGNARTGTDAYEADATTGLGGKVVRLERGYKDWRFGFRRIGTGTTGTILGGVEPCWVAWFGPNYADNPDPTWVVGGVTMAIEKDGAAFATATTDAAGNYEVDIAAAGSYRLTPAKAGFVFDPPSRTVMAGRGGNRVAPFRQYAAPPHALGAPCPTRFLPDTLPIEDDVGVGTPPRHGRLRHMEGVHVGARERGGAPQPPAVQGAGGTVHRRPVVVLARFHDDGRLHAVDLPDDVVFHRRGGPRDGPV